MHDHEGKNNFSMLWMMLPCLLLVGFLLFSGGALSSSRYLWPILIGGMVVAHIWMMVRGHRAHDGDHVADEEKNETDGGNGKDAHGAHDDKKQHGSCCH